jgi:peptidoglycan hydrolase CwlO-like protein
MSANAEAWFKDTDKEVEVLKNSVKETVWGNADGERGEVDISSTIERIETDYDKLKENIRNRFAETTDGKE